MAKKKSTQKRAQKRNWKLTLIFWGFAWAIYGACLSIFLTYLGPQVLEFMRWAGVWQGLGGALVGFLLALMVVPGVVALKVKKAPFGKMCLAWSILALGLLIGLAPVGTWFKDRGSFVPALLLGPESVVVERVVAEKFGWGDGWKVRPDGAAAEPDAVETPTPEVTASPTP